MIVRFRCDFRAFLLVTSATASLVMAWARAEARSIHIAAQPMAQALEALGRQPGQNIVFTPQQVAHVQANAVNGNMTAASSSIQVLQMNVYKSFTAEQDGDAIGGVIDLISMSANGLSGYAAHMGGGAKGTFSNTCLAGTMSSASCCPCATRSARYTTRNWQIYDYDNADGTSSITPGTSWDGHVRSGQYSTDEYANDVTNIGGSGKLEWKLADKHLYMSVMGWSWVL